MLSNRASGYTDAHNFGRRGVPDRAGRGPTLLHGYRLALARVFTTERATRSATMATSWPTRIVRLRSIAGRHSASPLLITQAPAGRARTPKPAPPFPAVSPPPPPPPITLAAGMIVIPSSWYGSPLPRATVMTSFA